MAEESERKTFYYLIRKMITADFMSNLDLVQMQFALQKEELLTENRKLLFNRIIADSAI